MTPSFRKSFLCWAILIASLLPSCSMASGNPKTFIFVSARYVITAEVASKHSFVVNFINLSDFVLVLQPGEFIYKSSSGRPYIGQVFDREVKDSKGEVQKYSASILIKPHSFTGLTILGGFQELEDIAELSIRIGAKRYYPQPVEKSAFEQFAAKIGDLDIENSNASAAMAAADIVETGSVKSTDGTSEWDRDWQGLLLPDGVNPPKIIEAPEISSTPEARKARTFGKVKLSGFINKSGGIQDLKVVKGLGRGLDQKAVEAIRNSWVFLPATKNGEVLDYQITLQVDFPPSDK
jgi:TonB family protein